MIKTVDSDVKTRIIVRCGNKILIDITMNGIHGSIDKDEIKSIRTYDDMNITVIEIEVHEYAKIQRHKLS